MKADVNFYTEQYTDEQDFSYLNDTLYDISQDDFSAYTVSPAVKARFKFPNKDPSPNLITDNRTPAQIVSDILRIWCQCLTIEEKQVWNLIAGRDLTKTLTLSSGLRIPKTFIDRDIKNFRNLQNAEKEALLEKLDSAPQTPYLPVTDHDPPSSHNSHTSPAPETQTSAMFVSPSEKLKLTVPTGLDQHGKVDDLLHHCHISVTQIRLRHENPPRLQ